MLAPAALGVLLAACGSSNNNNGTNPQVRLVNATQTAALTMSLNGSAQFSNVAAATASAYASVTPGNYTVTVASSSTSLVSSTLTVGLGTGQTYSVLAYDRDGAVFPTVFTENQVAPTTGYGTVSVENLSPDSGTLDLYVVPVGTTSLSGLTPTFQFVQYGASPSVTSELAGSYAMIATATGNPNDVRFTLGSLAIANGEILTLAFTSTTGGALVNGVVLTQGGSVQFTPNTSARVRIVSALPSSGSSPVVATVGGAPFATVFSPNPGSYTLVPGGATAYSISVAGTAIATLPAATFTTGGDFTILVYGSASSPSVSIFTDNNQVPVGGEIKLRLVNAGATGAGGLTMYDNNVQVASSVAYGSASPYFNVSVSSNSTLELVEASKNMPNIPISTSTPDSVFTVFVIDDLVTAPTIIRDR
jgi:hypothetical protein